MKQALEIENISDADDNPTGGSVLGTGIDISWQDGPLGRGEDRTEPNGAFVEGVIEAAMSRLEFYQRSKFSCYENQNAINQLQSALNILDSRTARREEAGVEGTHTQHPGADGGNEAMSAEFKAGMKHGELLALNLARRWVCDIRAVLPGGIEADADMASILSKIDMKLDAL